MIIESKKTHKQVAISREGWEKMRENQLQQNFKVIDASDLVRDETPIEVMEHIRAVKSYATQGMKVKEALEHLPDLSDEELQRVIDNEPRITITKEAKELYGTERTE